MNKSTLLWLIPVGIAFAVATAADLYFEHLRAGGDAPIGEIKTVSMTEFLAAVNKGDVTDGHIGYRPYVSNLADRAAALVAPASDAAKKKDPVQLRATGRLSDDD